jgi:probable HAF family extracellular repeat protein
VAHGINNRNLVVGASSNGQSVRPFLHEKGVMKDLGTVLGTVNSSGRAWAINEHGSIAGVSRNATDTASQATLWIGGAGGTIRNLGSLGDGQRFSEALAIRTPGGLSVIPFLPAVPNGPFCGATEPDCRISARSASITVAPRT